MNYARLRVVVIELIFSASGTCDTRGSLVSHNEHISHFLARRISFFIDISTQMNFKTVRRSFGAFHRY